jgi:hypothetical protein
LLLKIHGGITAPLVCNAPSTERRRSATDWELTKEDPSTQSFISLLVMAVLFVILFVYAAIHFLVIVPLVYFAYLITSVLMDAVLNAHSVVQITIGGTAPSACHSTYPPYPQQF